MKKFILAAALCVILGSEAFAQEFRGGVEGGFNISYITGFKSRYSNTAPYFGAYLGGVAQVNFTELIGISTGADIGMEGVLSTYDPNGNREFSHETVINIPILLSFSFNDDMIRAFVGPQLGFIVEAKDYKWLLVGNGWQRYVLKWDTSLYNWFQCSIDVGVRFLFTDNLGMTVRYNFGLTDVVKPGDVQFYIPGEGEKTFSIGHNHNFVGKIGLTYIF